MQILTFDIEEWFHLLDFDATRTEAEWEKYEVRIYKNVERIFRLLEETDTKATFFIIGWIAKRYPDLVREIAQRYQIGSHTMNHQLVWQQSPKAFREDVASSIHRLEDVTGQRVTCFRAPGFSIRSSERWAFETLAELGIEYDCSIFPASHAHGGMPEYGASGPAIIRCGKAEIREFPISTESLLGRSVAFSGGGYFRLMPYRLIRHWSQRQADYLMAYIHPRDLDGDQPVLQGLSPMRRFRSYVGVKGAEKKLRRYLQDFCFADVATAAAQIDWNAVKEIRL